MQGRDTGIFTRKKRFFLISPNFQGLFSRKIGQKGAFLRWVSGWDVWDTGLQGAGTGADVPKKNGAVAVSSEKCCKFAGQLRAIVEGKRADFSERNSSSPKGGAYTRFINYSRQ